MRDCGIVVDSLTAKRDPHAQRPRFNGHRRQSVGKLILRPKQEHLLQLLRDHGSLAPKEIWEALDISRQGAMDRLRPLIEAGLVEKLGTKKSGRYVLKQP